jgi:hypothetical protein
MLRPQTCVVAALLRTHLSILNLSTLRVRVALRAQKRRVRRSSSPSEIGTTPLWAQWRCYIPSNFETEEVISININASLR